MVSKKKGKKTPQYQQASVMSSQTSNSVDMSAKIMAPKVDKNKLLQERVRERKERSDARRAEAEKHKEIGNTHFRAGNYRQAIDEYQVAVDTHGPRAAYLSNLAAAWLKLEEWDAAEDCAQRALEHDPTLMKARYRRGLARKGNLQLNAAAMDFRVVLTEDPTIMEARLALTETTALLALRGEPRVPPGDKMPPELEEAIKPLPDEEAIELESLSDSSDCRHRDNDVPCRFYNHDGCARGLQCAFSHAPDHKSIRDELGRNVCLYYLFDACKFGAAKCVYAHETTYLRRGGWWEDPHKRALYCVSIAATRQVELDTPVNATFMLSVFENTRIWNWPELSEIEAELRKKERAGLEPTTSHRTSDPGPSGARESRNGVGGE
ncbi:hypothetical protein BC834DRAFT_237375 [Gloeopeniophorella convolvens]|nr:hypothetical protein BC834DRAFT_237375 [Gloeopeniophorella convolvens]